MSEVSVADCSRESIYCALSLGQFWPALQPIVDMRSGAIAGFEVLARWSDPVQGEVPPSAFIAAMEKFSLIDQLTSQLMEKASDAACQWAGQFFLAFNVAPSQLVSGGLDRLLERAMKGSGFPIDRIEVEITEGSLIEDAEAAFSCLRELNDRGIKISIDDFGSGYSNLGRLAAIPFSKLKIDRRFIDGIAKDSGKRRIVAALIGLGHSLGMSIVAEGLEAAEDQAILRELGCDLGQGWLYGKPVKLSEAADLLRRVGVKEEAIAPLDSSPFQQFHQLATLYDQAPVGLCFLDLQYRHVRVNEKFAALHGTTPLQLEGKYIDDVMSGGVLERIQNALSIALADGDAPPQDYHFKDRDYRIFNRSVSDVGGELIGYSVVSVDVTEQNRSNRELSASERHFRRSLELSPNIAWAAAHDAIIDYMSPLFEESPGLTMRQRIDEWISRIHPDDAARVISDWLSWAAAKGPYEAEFRMKWNDGNYRWVKSRAIPYQEADDLSLRWYGIITDVSKQKNAELKIAYLEGALDDSKGLALPSGKFGK